jgi:hypothetical protein
MKVRLIGINEEDRYDHHAPTALTFPPPRARKAIVARFEGCDGDVFTHLGLRVEQVDDFRIGDEYTLHLEHVKK